MSMSSAPSNLTQTASQSEEWMLHELAAQDAFNAQLANKVARGKLAEGLAPQTDSSNSNGTNTNITVVDYDDLAKKLEEAVNSAYSKRAAPFCFIECAVPKPSTSKENERTVAELGVRQEEHNPAPIVELGMPQKEENNPAPPPRRHPRGSPADIREKQAKREKFAEQADDMIAAAKVINAQTEETIAHLQLEELRARVEAIKADFNHQYYKILAENDGREKKSAPTDKPSLPVILEDGMGSVKVTKAQTEETMDRFKPKVADTKAIIENGNVEKATGKTIVNSHEGASSKEKIAAIKAEVDRVWEAYQADLEKFTLKYQASLAEQAEKEKRFASTPTDKPSPDAFPLVNQPHKYTYVKNPSKGLKYATILRIILFITGLSLVITGIYQKPGPSTLKYIIPGVVLMLQDGYY